MTTTTASSSRRQTPRGGGGESSTIPTPRLHSSIDTSLKTSHLLLERPPIHLISNPRRTRKLDEKSIFCEMEEDFDQQSKGKSFFLDPHDILLEPQVNNKNANRYLPSPSEQVIRTTYNDLLEKFFDTHQPSYIFEPLRKEYYWTNEPFDQEKITRLEKSLSSSICREGNDCRFRLLQNTSFFVQSIFWYLRIVLAICVTVPIEIVHTILAGLVKPILVRSPIILADTLIKPFHSGLFNALM